MIYQAIGIVLVAAGWAIFAWRWEVSVKIGIYWARYQRRRRKLARGHKIYQRMAGNGNWIKPWGQP